MIKQKCDNCGKKAGLFAKNDLFFVCPKGKSWENYYMEYKIFCSKNCIKEYRKKNLQRIKEIAKSKDSWKFKMTLLMRNPIAISIILLGIIMTGVCSYWIIEILTHPTRYLIGDTLSEMIIGPLGIAIIPIVFFIFCIIYLINHPWIIPKIKTVR